MDCSGSLYMIFHCSKLQLIIAITEVTCMYFLLKLKNVEIASEICSIESAVKYCKWQNQRNTKKTFSGLQKPRRNKCSYCLQKHFKCVDVLHWKLLYKWCITKLNKQKLVLDLFFSLHLNNLRIVLVKLQVEIRKITY